MNLNYHLASLSTVIPAWMLESSAKEGLISANHVLVTGLRHPCRNDATALCAARNDDTTHNDDKELVS